MEERIYDDINKDEEGYERVIGICKGILKVVPDEETAAEWVEKCRYYSVLEK